MMQDQEATRLGFNSRLIQLKDLDVHLVDAGASAPIVFLHGFPDYWGAWQGLMRYLQGNYRVVAPDLRGYGLTSRPESVEAYTTEILINDGLAVLDWLSAERVVLVGHDWGATLAFYIAMRRPERVAHLVILNGAHPYILQDRIWDDREQREASQYIAQIISGEAGQRLNADNAAALADAWLGKALRDQKISREHFDRYVALWSDTDAWPAMMNWYRGSPFQIPKPGDPSPKGRWTQSLSYRVDCNVSVIWGQLDEIFSINLAHDLKPHVRHLEIYPFPDCGHVPHRDAPAECAEIISNIAAEAFD